MCFKVLPRFVGRKIAKIKFLKKINILVLTLAARNWKFVISYRTGISDSVLHSVLPIQHIIYLM